MDDMQTVFMRREARRGQGSVRVLGMKSLTFPHPKGDTMRATSHESVFLIGALAFAYFAAF